MAKFSKTTAITTWNSSDLVNSFFKSSSKVAMQNQFCPSVALLFLGIVCLVMAMILDGHYKYNEKQLEDMVYSIRKSNKLLRA